MNALWVPVAGCVLQIATTDVLWTDDGWTEHTTLEIGADPGCAHVEIPLPPAVRIVDRSGHVALGDGRRLRSIDARFEDRPRSRSGVGGLRVHTPDLLAGDRLVVELSRRWERTDAFAWSPTSARYAELRADDVSWDVVGVTHDDRKGLAWVADPAPDAAVRLSTPGTTPWTSPSAHLVAPATLPTHARRLTLQVPARDPQRALYPGGGSSVRVEEELSFVPEDADRGWVVPARGAQAPEVRITPSADAAEVTRRDDGFLVTVPASEGPADVYLAYTLPDAPTYGERLPGTTLDVRAPDGNIAWEADRFWVLTDVHDRPILPARSALVKALDNRFRASAIPEPGVPTALRGRRPSWDLAPELVDALHERATPAPIAGGPALPRPLAKARKSGVLTSVEAGLITWLYARQSRLASQWLLVRGADEGPGGRVSLAGYDDLLVQIGNDDDLRWVDPGCRVCGPYEVRPELEGASIIAPVGVKAPPPTPGTWTVVLTRDRVAWRLEGPPALQLRRRLADVPLGSRDGWLAALVGGPGATLHESRGLDARGATIELLADRGDGAIPLPLDLPPVRDDGTTWVPWLGERTVQLTEPSLALPAPFEGDAVALAVDGRTVTLTVRDRTIGTDDATRTAAAAATVRGPAPQPDAEPEGDREAETAESPADAP